jgi:hypothetical protein
MDTTAVNRTAARVGLSNTTVNAVVSTYLEYAEPAADTPAYVCPFCDKGYKTARGAKSHLASHRKKGK